jgi:hypothetical protein
LDLPETKEDDSYGQGDGSSTLNDGQVLVDGELPDGALGDGSIPKDGGKTDGATDVDAGPLCGGTTHCYGGACPAGTCEPIAITSSIANPRAIAFDGADEIFVVSASDHIFSVDLEGNVSPPLATTEPNLISSIVATASNVYFASSGDGSTAGSEKVSRCASTSCAGANRTELLTSKFAIGNLAIDNANLYVSQSGSGVNGAIFSCALPSTSCVSLVTAAAPFPELVAASTGKVFWTQGPSISGFTSCTATSCSAGATGTNDGVVSFTADDPTDLYYGTSGGINGAAKTGGASTNFFSDMHSVTSIAVKGNALYWIDVNGTTGTIYTCDTASCTSHSTVVSNLVDPAPNALIVTSNSLFYSTQGSAGANNAVWRLGI